MEWVSWFTGGYGVIKPRRKPAGFSEGDRRRAVRRRSMFEVYTIKCYNVSMKQKRAYKYRVDPMDEQKRVLARTFGCARFVYNWALRQKTDAFYQENKRLYYKDLSESLTLLKQQDEYSWLSEVSSVPLQQALRHLDKAFLNFFEGRANYPTFKKKRHRQSATYTSNAFKWDGTQLTLAKMSEPLHIRWSRPGRSTQLQLAFGQMTLLPPRHEPRASKEPLTVWVVRVWEEQAPAGEEPLQWILVTSVPTTTLEHAWERVDWYRHRWLVEDYHQCLKSGCRIEQRQLQSVDGLIRLLGLLSPLAVRLVQVRACAREDPERPAHAVIEPLMLAVLAERCGQSPLTMTVGTFWTEVARLGGYLARSHDGPPGWRTIWKGWLSLQTLLEGAQLAFHLRL